MTDINDEMKAAANYTIKTAKEKFEQELDFSEQSILKFESLLQQAYQSLSNRVDDEKKRNLIARTTNAWGSYLGEYMRLKWGGTWILRGSERILSVNNIEFSPISFVYQKITSYPAYTVKEYFAEAESKITSRSVPPPQLPRKPGSINPYKQNSIRIDKRLILAVAGISATLFVICACIVGFWVWNRNTVSPQFRTDLNVFLVESEKLNILTKQGVSNVEFRNQLAEVKSAYSLLNNNWPSFLSSEKNSFDRAIRGWELTLEIWDLKLNGLIWLSDNSTTLEEIVQYTSANTPFPSSIPIDEWISLLMGKASQYFEQGRTNINGKIK